MAKHVNASTTTIDSLIGMYYAGSTEYNAHTKPTKTTCSITEGYLKSTKLGIILSPFWRPTIKGFTKPLPAHRWEDHPHHGRCSPPSAISEGCYLQQR